MDEAQLLGLLGSQLAQTLEREATRHQEALARQRLEQDLNMARDISDLPAIGVPVRARLSDRGTYRAARQVGGDFCHFIELTPDPRTNVLTLAGGRWHAANRSRRAARRYSPRMELEFCAPANRRTRA